MDGTSRSDRSLERIVALIAALAVLAERTAERSFPVRWLILTVLRRAEPVARAFVAEATFCEFPSPGEFGELRYDPDDAILLAAQFRALAALLAAILPAESLAGSGADAGRRIDDLAGRRTSTPADRREGRTTRREATGPPRKTRTFRPTAGAAPHQPAGILSP